MSAVGESEASFSRCVSSIGSEGGEQEAGGRANYKCLSILGPAAAARSWQLNGRSLAPSLTVLKLNGFPLSGMKSRRERNPISPSSFTYLTTHVSLFSGEHILSFGEMCVQRRRRGEMGSDPSSSAASASSSCISFSFPEPTDRTHHDAWDPIRFHKPTRLSFLPRPCG